jgi:copper chaperone CopZ
LTCVKEISLSIRYDEYKDTEGEMKMKKTYQLDTLTCPSCVVKIETTLKRMEGIGSAEVMFNSSRVKVDFDDAVLAPSKIKSTITNLGYDVLSEK